MFARRALQIIRHAAKRSEPTSAGKLSESLNLPRPTVYRLVTLLEKEDVLQRSANNKQLEPSSKFPGILPGSPSNGQIVQGLRAVMANAADAWGAATSLGRLYSKPVKLVHAVTPSGTSIPFVHPRHGPR